MYAYIKLRQETIKQRATRLARSLPAPFTPALTANVEINFLLYPGRESPAERPTVYSNANISGVFAGESILFTQLSYPQITSVRLTGFQNYYFNSFKWKDRSTTDRMERRIKESQTENVGLEDLTGDRSLWIAYKG
jgi:hypothetical protein